MRGSRYEARERSRSRSASGGGGVRDRHRLVDRAGTQAAITNWTTPTRSIGREKQREEGDEKDGKMQEEVDDDDGEEMEDDLSTSSSSLGVDLVVENTMKVQEGKDEDGKMNKSKLATRKGWWPRLLIQWLRHLD